MWLIDRKIQQFIFPPVPINNRGFNFIVCDIENVFEENLRI